MGADPASGLNYSGTKQSSPFASTIPNTTMLDSAIINTNSQTLVATLYFHPQSSALVERNGYTYFQQTVLLESASDMHQLLYDLPKHPSPLLLPVFIEQLSQGYCSVSNVAVIYYELYTFLLEDQIKNRKSKNSPFTQAEIWYMLLTLLQTYQYCKTHSYDIGQINIASLCLNHYGEIKVRVDLKKIFCQSNNNFQHYQQSIGKIMRQIIMLQSTNNNAPLSIQSLSVTQLLGLKYYSKELLIIIVGLCLKDKNHIDLPDIAKMIHPFAQQIKDFKEFKVYLKDLSESKVNFILTLYQKIKSDAQPKRSYLKGKSFLNTLTENTVSRFSITNSSSPMLKISESLSVSSDSDRRGSGNNNEYDQIIEDNSPTKNRHYFKSRMRFAKSIPTRQQYT